MASSRSKLHGSAKEEKRFGFVHDAIVSALTDNVKPANKLSCANPCMSTLIERLEEVMREMSWGRDDLMRVSKQSSSVVSQWLGKSSKIIKTIGKMEAAEGIAEASGYSALWIAKGIGAKKNMVRGPGSASTWPLLAITAARYEALTPGARLIAEGAMLQAIEKIEQAKRKSPKTAKESPSKRVA